MRKCFIIAEDSRASHWFVPYCSDLSNLLIFGLLSEHRIDLPYSSVDDMRRAYDFKDLQAFLDIYKLARNAFRASFLNPAQKQKYLKELNDFVSSI
jgi:adenosine deaminase